jgi:hypothetical protein
VTWDDFRRDARGAAGELLCAARSGAAASARALAAAAGRAAGDVVAELGRAAWRGVRGRLGPRADMLAERALLPAADAWRAAGGAAGLAEAALRAARQLAPFWRLARAAARLAAVRCAPPPLPPPLSY